MIRVEDWGRVEYEEALARQRAIFEGVMEGGEGAIIFCEHEPVFTLGRNGDEGNILAAHEMRRRGAKVVRTDRGGDVTFHGPGQLVVYPVLDMGRLGLGLREYIGLLEQAVIDTLAEFGISGVRSDKGAGVWVRHESRVMSQESERIADGGGELPQSVVEPVEEGAERRSLSRILIPRKKLARSAQAKTQARPVASAGASEDETPERSIAEKASEDETQERSTAGGKICAIGVRASRGVVMHGLALNVTTDLEWFRMINPCGMAGEPVARMEAEMDEVKSVLEDKLMERLAVKY